MACRRTCAVPFAPAQLSALQHGGRLAAAGPGPGSQAAAAAASAAAPGSCVPRLGTALDCVELSVRMGWPLGLLLGPQQLRKCGGRGRGRWPPGWAVWGAGPASAADGAA
jgi:hypothetical protein